MTGGTTLAQIEIDLRSHDDHTITVYVDVLDNPLAGRWLSALEHLLREDYHLEKNYCFLGFARGDRTGDVILSAVNRSIEAINQANLGYHIQDEFTMSNCLTQGPIGDGLPGRQIIHDKFNRLHRYFEDLQGQSGRLSDHYLQADARTRWHIRQLNLLCHEFESWALSYCKEIKAPMWQRPSQLMCWLNAPRFLLEPEDFSLFGIDTLNRPMGGVFVGVNKSVGKHHWEVFNDEGRDSRISELATSALISQTQASGDFDIEWGNNVAGFHWQQKRLAEFRDWLTVNGFDPDDPSLTIGHPQVAQVDLMRSFDSDDYRDIWQRLNTHLDVLAVRTGTVHAIYPYRWNDRDFIDRQVDIINKGM